MSSSPVAEPASPTSAVSPPSPSPALHNVRQFHTSTPNYVGKKQPHSPLNVSLPATAPGTPPTYGEPTLTPPPRSPGPAAPAPASGDSRAHPPDGTSSDKSSETAVGNTRTASTALSRKESYKAQRQHYRKEKKRAASALLHSIEDPSVVVLADWLKVRGSLKSWTKLWCVLKPGLLLLYKSPKAKSSHWVGTVLLTSCQVIERPSKKDGFCFKLYHPLEQSIWAPRGPHNETIGAVVQPLPTAHLIFRAPSQAAGHCWLDGLELALRCSNAMLRCSRRAPEAAAGAPALAHISHEELERHFNDQVPKLSETPHRYPPALMSVSDYSPKKRSSSNERKVSYQIAKPKPSRKISKWTQFVESIDILSKEQDSSDSQTAEHEKKDCFLDLLKKKEPFERNALATSSAKDFIEPKLVRQTSKSLASSPLKVDSLVKKTTPILRCFELPKLPLPLGDKKNERDKTSTPTLEENLMRFMSSFPKRRSSTPSTIKSFLTQKRISYLRESGVKTDSENDDFLKCALRKKKKSYKGSAEVICTTPDNITITKTAPSVERFRRYSSSSTDEVRNDGESRSPGLRYHYQIQSNTDKYSLIDCQNLPSVSFEALKNERRDERLSSQNVYVAGKIVQNELFAGASDSDSEVSRGAAAGMPEALSEKRVQDAVARIEGLYVEDQDKDIGQAGELVEEVAEENKSLLWFLLKQVRPGMDLSKVVLPTFILEPRSFLDKLSDSYYHADLLTQAKTLDDPYQRFKCVLRFYLSGLYKKPKGLKKPYNPVLGEIFRCCWRHRASDTYTFYIAEQVSHHPPISAFYVSNRKDGYVIEGSLLARSKFYGNSTSAILEGCARVHLLHWGETYLTTAPYAHCKGIVMGSLSMELGGKVQIMCESTGYHADIEFKLRSFLGSSDQTNAISGRIKKGRDTVATVEGYWDGKIDIKEKKTGEESNLLDVSILKEQRMTRLLMSMQHQQEWESQKLWAKVSEAILNDDQVAATEQKTIVEEGQRNRARNLVAPWVPRLFTRHPPPDVPEGVVDQGYKYNHGTQNPWQPEEIFEYEEDFVIKSLCAASPDKERGARHELAAARAAHPDTDSDSREDAQRKHHKTSARTLKTTLLAIDAALRDQTNAIERLSRTVEAMNEGQRSAAQFRPQNVGRIPHTANSWDLFGGFVLALILQAVLNWMFAKRE